MKRIGCRIEGRESSRIRMTREANGQATMTDRKLPMKKAGNPVEHTHRPVSYLAAGLLMVLFGAGEARSHDEQHAGHALGKVEFPISCSGQALAGFNHAVALLHHMTYPQAREAFEQVATTDPQCAMAHWGVAMTLFQPLWPTRPKPDALKRRG